MADFDDAEFDHRVELTGREAEDVVSPAGA